MRRALRRIVIPTMLLAASFGPLSPAARADVSGIVRFSAIQTRTSIDVGCREQDLITLTETIRGQTVAVNGGLRIDVLMSGIVTFEEAGESFVGRSSYPFTLVVRSDGSTEISQAFTSVARGDRGDVAELHVTAHGTSFPDGTIAVEFAIVHQSCSGA